MLPYTIEVTNGTITKTQTAAKADFTFNGLKADTYSIIIRDALGCGIPTFTEEITGPSPVVVTDFESTMSCDGVADGVIRFDIEGGLVVANKNAYRLIVEADGFYQELTIENTDVTTNAVLSYNTLADLGALEEGVYRVIIQDANADYIEGGFCARNVFEENITLSQIHISGNVKHKTCPGGDYNGELQDVLITGGSGDYEWQWTYPDGSIVPGTGDVASIFNLDIGEYLLEVTDKVRGCPVSRTFEIKHERALLITDFNLKDVSCYNGNDGYIKEIKTNAADPSGLSYAWVGGNPGAESDSEQLNLSARDFIKVTVKDAEGCIAVLETKIEEPDQLVFDLASTITSCDPFNQEIRVDGLVGGNGDKANYTYEWTDPDGILSEKLPM